LLIPRLPESVGEFQAKTLEAASAFADLNQRVFGELIELSSSAARESLRALAELQGATVEAVRSAPGTVSEPRDVAADLARDPMAWCRQGVESAIEGTQKVVKLLETQAQIVGRSAERGQASAERSGKEIREAFSSYTARLRQIYGQG
jgi:hypothetical protein